MPDITVRRAVAVATIVFIGTALLILSGLLPESVRGTVYLLLPISWLTVCCGLASMALSRTRRAG